MGSILKRRRTGNKKKRLRFLIITRCQIKSATRLNNLWINCKLINKKKDCSQVLYEKTHKCKEYGSKNYELAEYMAKRRKKSKQYKAKSTRITKERVKIVKLASLTNKNTLCQYICTYSYFFSLFRPNTYIKFRLTNTSKVLLTNFLSLLKSSIQADLFTSYSRHFKIYLLMILCFRAKLGYKNPLVFFILLENLALALQNLTIIENNL